MQRDSSFEEYRGKELTCMGLVARSWTMASMRISECSRSADSDACSPAADPMSRATSCGGRQRTSKTGLEQWHFDTCSTANVHLVLCLRNKSTASVFHATISPPPATP